MKKRLISIGVFLSIILSSIPCFAEETYLTYTPGERTQVIELDTQLLEANKEKVFDIVLNFDALSLTVLYEAQSNTNLTLKTDMGDNTVTLSAENTEGTIQIKPEIRRGQGRISLVSNKDITINGLTFNKVNYYPISKRLTQIVSYTDYEKAVEDVVVMGVDNPVVKVNGALRYVDYDNTENAVRLLDSKMYVPVKTFARAFSLYYEDYNDLKNFVYLSNDSFELYCSSHNGSYYIINGNKESIKNPVVYIDGVAHLPLRYISELIGKTVEYQDGLTVIGDEASVTNVVCEDEIFEELKNEISKFAQSNETTENVYYVSDKLGAEGNPGSEELPFKRIQQAADIAKPGDTVIIKEGIYKETVTPRNDGTPSAPIIFKAAEGANVVISAMNTVTGFKQYKDNIFYADIPKSLGVGRNFVTIDDEAIIEGRHPNTDTHTIAKMYKTEDTEFQRKLYPIIGDLIVTEEDTTKNKFTLESEKDLEQAQNFWQGATVVAMHSSGWTLSTGEVIESSQGKVIVKDINPSNYGFTYYKTKPYETDFGYITNHLNTVDNYGEWYINEVEKKIYMIPPKGVSGDDLVIELKQRQTLIDLTERSYIQFKNINTCGGGITMKDSTMCVINGGEHKYISHFTQNTSPHVGALGTTNTDAEGTQTKGEVGEYISGRNNAFVNAKIDGSAGAGIYSAGAYSYIDNNIVLNTDYAGIYPSGITIEGERWNSENIVRGGHTITGNTVKYAGRGCLYNSQNSRKINNADVVFPTVANDICYNEFGRGCIISRDGGVIYDHGIVAGNDKKQTTLHHNVVYDHIIQPASDEYTSFFGIYRDVHSIYEQCYSNIYLNTDNDSDFAGKIDSIEKAFFINTSTKDGPSYTEDFNNIFLGYRNYEQDGLLPADYPGGRMFLAGAKKENRFIHNIEETASEKTVLAEDFTLENGCSAENGTIKIQNAGESAIINNINCNPGAKQIKLSFTGDKYDINVYCFEIGVIKEGNVIYTESAYISGGGSDLDDVCEKVVYIPESIDTGNDFTLRLRAKDKNSIAFHKLVIDNFNGEISEKIFPNGSKIIGAGIGNVLSGGSNLEFKRTVKQTDEFRNNPIAKIGNTTISYNVVTDEINAIQVMMSTDLQNSNGTLSIYADSDEKPLCTIDLRAEYLNRYGDAAQNLWKRIDTNKEFSKVLPAGEHTFSFVFKKSTMGLFTPDFNNFALYNTKNQ